MRDGVPALRMPMSSKASAEAAMTKSTVPCSCAYDHNRAVDKSGDTACSEEDLAASCIGFGNSLPWLTYYAGSGGFLLTLLR